MLVYCCNCFKMIKISFVKYINLSTATYCVCIRAASRRTYILLAV